MTFALTEDQTLIRDSAARFLADASDSAAVRRAMASTQGYDEPTWARIARELGWCAIPIAEPHGGLGLGAVEMALVFEQAGYRLLCSPLMATVGLGVPLLQQLASAAAQADLLPSIAEGALRLGLALPDYADWTADATSLHASPDRGGWRLSGEASMVLDGASADQLLLFATVDDGDRGFFSLRRDSTGVDCKALDTWDAGRRFAHVRLHEAVAQRLDDAGVDPDALRRATAIARLHLAAEQLGNAQACLDLTVAYVGTRKQFGRTIAGFQAVKHRCAEMMVRVEALRSAVQGAALLAARPATDTRTLEMECAAVRALAADTAFWSAQEAIQLHGGVGFTWEYDPQLYFKRAQAAVAWLGRVEDLREGLAHSILDQASCPRRRASSSGPDDEGLCESESGSMLLSDRQNAARGNDGIRATDADDFRAEVAAWMHAHLVDRFAVLKHRGGPGDEEFEPALRKEWERELADGGWTCVGWAREHGGRGLSIEQQVIFHEEYARAGGPGRMGHIGEGLIGPAIAKFGTEAQKRRFLPAILRGTEFWAQGYSEPNAGSDLANVQTRCWQEADGAWRVQGQKIWTSLAHESDWIFVLARSDQGSKGNKGLAFLLLPLQQPGIEIRPIRQMSGGSEFNEVFFDGARADADHIVGAPGDGWKVAMGLLEIERGVSTLGQQMHFAHELDLVVQAAQCSGLDRDPIIRQRIAQAWIGLRTMRGNALRMLAGDGLSLGREALIYKYFWSNWHRDLGKLAMDVLGARAQIVSDDADTAALQRLFFFSRADTIYAGTNEIQLNLIAERGLGMPREPRPA